MYWGLQSKIKICVPESIVLQKSTAIIQSVVSLTQCALDLNKLLTWLYSTPRCAKFFSDKNNNVTTWSQNLQARHGLCKHSPHVSSGSLLLSRRILLSTVNKIQLHQSHRFSTSQFRASDFTLPVFHSISWLSVLSNVASPSLCHNAASDKMLQIIEAHPYWPVYTDVFEHPPPRITSQCPIWSDMTPVDTTAQWRAAKTTPL